jgi:cation diffusion facilitator CzcD-associated flavoprotein CzcO
VQTVLLIGASTSSTDIAREIDGVAKKVYQSSRGGQFDLPLSFLPPNTSRIGECSSFQFDPKDNGRGTVYLKDGSILPGIDKVVVCTGYHISYPFLREYHDDFLKAEQADERILVTDGTQVHNLHKDIFYIPDPTLAFVGTSYYVATMSFFEFQAIAVAAVFSGRAKLPSEEEMREEYRAKVVNKGYGRAFHALHGIEAETVRELVEWINADAELSGAPKIQGHSDEWIKEDEVKLEKLRKRFAQKQQDNGTEITVGWLGTRAN